MVDVHPPATRKLNMSRIRSKNTKPELAVRELIRKVGYGYRLHAKDLPGKPDLVFRGKKKVIFVNGCFWHRHTCDLGGVRSKTNSDFWENKILSNVQRDQRNIKQLQALGWGTLVIWECELRDKSQLELRLQKFLGDGA